MSVERGKRYFKYILTGTFVAGDIPIRVNLPPLSEIGFSQHYKECLIKVKSVYANSTDGARDIEWSDGAGTFLGLGGISMLTTIPCRQQTFLSSVSNIIEGQTAGAGNFENRMRTGFGILLHDSQQDTADPQGIKSVIHKDDSDIERSGVLCAVPFGSQFEITFVQSQLVSSAPVNLFIATAGTPAVATGVISIELEVLLI